MWHRSYFMLIISFLTILTSNAQEVKSGINAAGLPGKASVESLPQGFFLDGWKNKTVSSPSYTDTEQITNSVTVSLTIDFQDTLARVSPYLFGDNANLWTGPMSNNAGLMKHMSDRKMGVLRGPGGSTSDIFFWNAMLNTVIDSIPATLPGSTATDWPWYGKRPKGWDNWTMDVDSFYNILGHVDATGMITVNYGYARYGTSKYPVRKAAHLAAEWVRYDNGRSKYWEIGNEVFGSWEAGYTINTATNLDGQPETINGTLYGQHCKVFIDSMKAAAAEIGKDIKIGVVMLDAYSSSQPYWNKQVATEVGDKADFYIVHSYFTPYNTNSLPAVILSSPPSAGTIINYVWDQVALAGKGKLPVALTEYNIFAIGSLQQVSHINGMHAVMVVGEAMKQGYGAACRWDLANGWDTGNDHGMFSFNEPFIENYTPRPAFYHLYYFQKYTGDVLLNSTQTGGSNIVIIPTAFSSGQVGAAILNTSTFDKVIRLNIRNFKFGDRYYTYTLSGTSGETFSRKVYVNGVGNSLVAGGPDDYETINAMSSLIGDEIRIRIPPYSSVFVLVEPGTKELVINDQVSAVNKTKADNEVIISPNPATDNFTIRNIPAGIKTIEIKDFTGMTLYKVSEEMFDTQKPIYFNFAPGCYFVNLYGETTTITRKLMIR